MLTHAVMLWFSPNGYYCRDDDIVHGKGLLYTTYRDWLLPF